MPGPDLLCRDRSRHCILLREGRNVPGSDWNILAELQNYPEMVGKWDVAVLPKCPDPESGDGRATISNGLCYATAASNKNLDTVKDILKFFGSEEGQRIQGESGAAIPAYQGLEDTWAGCFAEYPINIQCFIEMFEYSIQSVNNASRPEWKSKVNDELLKIYAGTEDIETGLQEDAGSWIRPVRAENAAWRNQMKSTSKLVGMGVSGDF